MKLPQGKGWYIWILLDCEYGNPVELVRQAQLAGITHVLIKVSNGTAVYNGDLAAAVAAFQAAGIEVWAWFYAYGFNPAVEATLAVNRTLQYRCTGLVINAEAEWKKAGMKSKALTLTSTLRAGLGPNISIGLSSYRYPTIHPEFPWREFLANVDFVMPQIYHMQAHNPGEQLRRCVQEFKALAPGRPIVPTGAAFKEHGWRAEPVEVYEFLQTAKELGFEGVNFWEWGRTRRDLPACWDVVSAYPWSPTPPDVPVDPELQGTLMRVRAGLAVLNVRSGPGTSYPMIGRLCAGDIVEIRQVCGNDAWIEFEPGHYCAVRIGGRVYMEPV